jgi:8-oxo-dGTP pyrophosphatase MutT (NUDIX family)
MHAPTARLRAASYITRTNAGQRQLLVFEYAGRPDLGTHLPGGGVDVGERPDRAAIREAVEETGVTGRLKILGTVGLQQGHYNNGNPCISIFFHLHTEERRDRWSHSMIGDSDAWDTGHSVECRFVDLPEAERLLKGSGYQQDQFLDLLEHSSRE